MSNTEYFGWAEKFLRTEVGEIKKMYYALATKICIDMTVDARMELIRQFVEHTDTIMKLADEMKYHGIEAATRVEAIHNFCERADDINVDEDDEDHEDEEEDE